MKNKIYTLLNFRKNTSAICIAALILALSSCGTSRKSQKEIEIKNQISWAIKFKPGTPEDDKIKALVEIKAKILKDINKQNSYRRKVLRVTFKELHDFHHPEQVLLMVILNGDNGTEAKISVKPIHSPRFEMVLMEKFQ